MFFYVSCFVDVSRKRYLITSASFAFFFDNFFRENEGGWKIYQKSRIFT